MSKKILSFFSITAVFGLFLFVWVSAVRADQLAINFTNTTGSNLSNPPFTLGWEFQANANITVTGLGIFDARLNGLIDSYAIGLWNSVGTLLVSTTIPSGTSATLDDKFRMVSVAPTNLTAGNEYFIGALFLTSNDGLIAGTATGFSTDPAITFIENSFKQGSSLTFPSSTTGATPAYFGPNFTFVPEPSTLFLLGAGLVALSVWARIKTN
jgi:hypothetical protein